MPLVTDPMRWLFGASGGGENAPRTRKRLED
jgi:hypothetical protein